MKKYITVLWVVMLVCVSKVYVLAEIPRSLTVQGVLSNSVNDIDNVYIIKTALYSAVSDVNILYTQFDTLRIEKNGLFIINLGKESGLPLSIPFDRQYVVEFSVNGIVMPVRMPLQSVPYAITSEKVSDNSVELRHLSEELKSVLQLNDDSEKGEMNLANYVAGHRAVIAGGDENRTSASFSSILGGYFNSVTGNYGTIAGGQSNLASGSWSFVGGGLSNRAFGTFSTVTAGANNVVSSSASYGSIGGGGLNQIGGLYATIAGGNSNTASGNYANIGGGNSNRTIQDFSTIAGGSNNNAAGFGSTIGGGISNISSGQHAFIGGGKDNIAMGMNTIVVGGLSNNASGMSTGISSGQSNTVSGSHSSISGGLNNRITAIGANISGGINNSLSADYSTISGGSTNIIAANFGTISGGGSNVITNTATFATISGGQNNVNQGRFSGIVGGYSNVISQNSSSNISGGDSNQITQVSSGNSNNSVISGGRRNIISNSSFSSINGGRLNSLLSSSDFSKIGGGFGNSISSSNHAVISAGKSNSISGSHGATVSGGESNVIGTASLHAFIGSGLNNTIGNNSMQSLITGGNTNSIGNSSPYSSVLSGYSNKVNGDYSVITGGLENTINGEHGYISGGEINSITGSNGTIIGGRNNKITSNAEFGTIIGGRNNTVESEHAITIGQSNTVLAVNGIAIGQSNGTSSGAINSVSIGNNNNLSAAHSFAIGTGNIATSQHEFAIGAYSDDAFNPASTSNTSFTGNRKFSFGIGISTSQRKNAITVFDQGNTLIQGKIMVTDTAFLNIASIASNASIGGSVNIAGNLTIGGILSTTGIFVASNITGTNTGDITIGTANGLSLSGQVLSLSSATITDPGAMSASDKTKLNSIAPGAEVNVNADWNAITGDAQILNKPMLGTMSSETVGDYYTKTQVDAGFQVKDADLTSVATIGTSDQLIRVKNDATGLEWFTPSYISSYTETDPQVGTIVSSGIPRWNGTTLVTGSLSDDGTNISTSGTFTSSNLSGTNTGDITIGTANGLSLSGQVLSLDTATIISNGAMTYYDKVKLNALSNHNSSSAFLPTKVTAEERNALTNLEAGMIAFCSDCGLQGELQYYSGTNWATFTGDPVASLNGLSKTQVGNNINGISQSDHVGQINSMDMSYDGSILAVGYPSNGSVNTNGMVKVFLWNGSSWLQLGSDIIGESAYDQFGAAVSISNDGKILAIGAPLNDGGALNAGSVRIYNWNGSNWLQVGIDIDGNSSNLNVGSKVDLSGNGKTLAIMSSSGKYQFYRQSSSTWSQTNSNIGLGRSVSFSFDGKTVAVSNINHVHVYYDNGTDWSLKGGSHLNVDAETLANVSMNHDGNIVAIGIPLNDDNGNNAGKVRIMRWNGFAWITMGSDILGQVADDNLGYSVSLSSDGKKLIVGAPYNNGNGNHSGQAKIFQWNGENWIQQSTDIDGIAADDKCGSSVSISGDGTRVAIGGPENVGGALEGGHVRVFK
ncbi:MAG: hypothetical protein RL734_634 [Bacteroidota bacterium]|jgi:hypothetical protein